VSISQNIPTDTQCPFDKYPYGHLVSISQIFHMDTPCPSQISPRTPRVHHVFTYVSLITSLSMLADCRISSEYASSNCYQLLMTSYRLSVFPYSSLPLHISHIPGFLTVTANNVLHLHL